MNDDVRKIFYTKSKIIKSIRNYLDGLGFLEVKSQILFSQTQIFI
jgi:lysyl-tRNA synthetase class II